LLKITLVSVCPSRIKDEEILQYIKDYTLKEFSHYMPQKRKIVLNLSLASNKVTNIE